MFEYLLKLLKIVRAGDTIVFDSVSRMSRNAETGFQIYQELYDKGVELVFLKYSSFEKGTNECHNRMLRRFVPKGKSISDYSQEDIAYFADIINGLPRKRLGYRTPETLFEQELDRICELNQAV